MIEDDEIGLCLCNEGLDLLGLSGTYIQTWIGRFASARDDAQDFGACGACERVELAQLILLWSMSQSDADQDRTFAAAGTFKQY